MRASGTLRYVEYYYQERQMIGKSPLKLGIKGIYIEIL